ncbi:putative transcriptional regulator, Crp/Fnr family [Methylovorus glucosotrophus SIP3-4]|uniref:Putative transcriptional regulator, Crp/Fnr family n=2 Tax=Methylovorus glucosotrophus TaxID=266009 RepID=C6XBC7_METGS|nr:putative transcriptional regulator, Crp/Fnr family [Methylovorus glucosotrophus SIP3-4]
MLHMSTSPFNCLLEALPLPERLSFISTCDSVELGLTQVLNQPDDTVEYVYFPLTCMVALTLNLEEGEGMEVALIGNEGMVGASLILGVAQSPFGATVQGHGLALRSSAPLFLEELARHPQLHELVKRYVHVSCQQFAQIAVCNRYHVVEKRLARLLLMTRDRMHSEDFYITHELLAKMLGVRRVGVTKAAGALHTQHLISYRRGVVRIDDAAGLEAAACSCYETDKAVYARLLVC